MASCPAKQGQALWRALQVGQVPDHNGVVLAAANPLGTALASWRGELEVASRSDYLDGWLAGEPAGLLAG